MRYLAIGAVAAVSAAMFAVPAPASFDHHFRVAIAWRSTVVTESGEGRIRSKARLVDPQHRHDRVGRVWAKCKIEPLRHCRILVHLNGRIGGFGNIAARGDLGRHDHRLNVVGGTRDFNGGAGKVVNTYSHRHFIDFLHFDLTR